MTKKEIFYPNKYLLLHTAAHLQKHGGRANFSNKSLISFKAKAKQTEF
jgi:hypothetical protein